MRDERLSNPIACFWVVLPCGISNGLCQYHAAVRARAHGFSVAAVGSVVALGLSANLWRFAGAPVVDLTLSLRRQYL
jgi:MFS transporter, PAT family, beta-lactamase induction signal transducer AmpG